MSDLRKTVRALDFDQVWPEMLLAACQLEGVEYTRETAMQVTMSLADKIKFDEETLEVDVGAITDAEVIHAVKEYGTMPEPAPTPEVVQQVDVLTQVLLSQEGFATRALEVQGVTDGQEWKQPTQALDAYPKGWQVRYGGLTWVSLVDGNAHQPGVSGWRIVTDDDEPAPWQQPSGTHDAYAKGDQVTHEGHVWISSLDNNVYIPGEYGWDKQDGDDK